jgi:hypothetical protein
MLKIVQYMGNRFPREMSVGDAVDLYDGSEGATTETGNFLDGKLPLRIGIGIVGNSEFLVKGLENVVCSFDVTGGSGTNTDGMFSCRFVPELIVKGRDGKNIGGRDVGFFADFVQYFAGQIAMFLLNALQDRNQRVFSVSVFGENVIERHGGLL